MREEDSNWFPEWEEALPSPEELTPQPLPQPTPTQANSSSVFTGAEQARPRRRFVWTRELHKRFVDAVEQLGINRALVKDIMEFMNVEGLTRRDVANHYQKYRHRLKLRESYYLIGPSSLHLHGQEYLESGAKTVLARED